MADDRAALRLGTRGSALALAQAELVADALGGAELVPIKTSGATAATGATGGDKARFVREIEQALLAGEVDLAVHSAKDLPTELPEGLEIAGIPAREDARDAFVGQADSLDEVPEGARIGTSSLRRRAQLLALRPDLELVGPARQRRHPARAGWRPGTSTGWCWPPPACAGSGARSEIAFELRPRTADPGAGTGRPGRSSAGSTTPPRRPGADASPTAAALADAQLRAGGGRRPGGELQHAAGRRTPSSSTGGRMRARGFCGLPDGSEWIRDELEHDASEPEALGRALAERMSAAGARRAARRAPRNGRAGGAERHER